MKRSTTALLLAVACGAASAPAAAQPRPSSAAVLERLQAEGTRNSQVERLAQALLDSIGPRLVGSPGQQAANDWAVAQYRQMGIPARNEQYGTWRGWRRGVSHIDLLQPRVRSLEGTMLAWSPGGRAEGPAVLLPEFADSAAFHAWLPEARGKLVLISFPQPTCRPDDNWKEWARPASFERMQRERNAAREAWDARIRNTGASIRELPVRLEQAGALGVVTSTWSQGWGVNRIFGARTERIPTVDLSCEDYGLVARLAENGQGPVLRIHAEAESTGEVPAFNTVAQIRGRERPNEYVVLSAHFDSWDGASGATDNGTGTVVMMEAMRILKQVYPQPRRTILAGHWGGEEQGLNGSRAFAADNPRIVQGLQALFNQDNGTGRIAQIGMQGFAGVGTVFGRWLGRLPAELVGDIRVDDPGAPSGGGSDHAAFVCHGAPAFMLSSRSWDYGTYTWHTNRDTYDKIAWDEVRNNAILVAMLAYLASEEPQRLPRARTTDLPKDPRTGAPATWPACQQPARSAAQSTR